MKEFWNTIQLVFAAVGGWLGYFLGSCDGLLIQVLGHPGVLRTAIIFFYLSNEGLSLTENAAHLGLPVPEKLKEVLEQLHDRHDEEER